MINVYVYPADETGCGNYRLVWPSRELIANGAHIKIVGPKERGSSLQGMTNVHGEMIDVRCPADADVIVLQRITHRHLIAGVELLRKRGVTVIIDMDDDLSMIHPAHPAFIAMHPRYGYQKDHSWSNAQLACDVASYVTVSTDALLNRYARHGRGRVLRNCVPQRYFDIPRVDSTVIGWGGSVHSHPDDLQVTGVGVEQVMNETTFRVVGPGDHVQRVLGLSRPPEVTGARDIHEEWPNALAELGIGIAPLADTLFNKSKSWLKPLEYAALGVPCVMSPRVEYQRIHKLGIGALASKPRQWTSRLRELVRSKQLRDEMSERGRVAASELTFEKNAWRWLETWQEAYDLEH